MVVWTTKKVSPLTCGFYAQLTKHSLSTQETDESTSEQTVKQDGSAPCVPVCREKGNKNKKEYKEKKEAEARYSQCAGVISQLRMGSTGTEID